MQILRNIKGGVYALLAGWNVCVRAGAAAVILDGEIPWEQEPSMKE